MQNQIIFERLEIVGMAFLYKTFFHEHVLSFTLTMYAFFLALDTPVNRAFL